MFDTAMAELAKHGITGILILALLVYVYYSETVKYPKMLATFKEETAIERAVCAKNHEDVMREIRTEGNSNRDMHQQTRHSLSNLATAANLKRAHDRHLRDDPPDPPG